MGNPTGFLEIARAENPWREEEARLGDFDEMHFSLPVQERREIGRASCRERV